MITAEQARQISKVHPAAAILEKNAESIITKAAEVGDTRVNMSFNSTRDRQHVKDFLLDNGFSVVLERQCDEAYNGPSFYSFTVFW